MPYNTDLEKRLDAISLKLGRFDKKKMFGGVGYMSNGNMVFGIHKEYLILRVNPTQAKELLRQKFVKVFDITGRPMAGWLMVAPEGVTGEANLRKMLNIAVEHVKKLPGK